MGKSTLHNLLVVGLVAIGACNEPMSVTREQPTESVVQALIAVPDDYVATPAGWYHRSCVHEIEDGALVGKNGLVTRRDGTIYQLTRCLYPVRGAPRAPGAHSPGSPSPTNNGWIEYASATQDSGNWYKELDAAWTVPANPVGSYSWITGGPPTFYTFPGLQSSAFIIQPVIQYGYNGEFGSASGWVMASWHCDTGPGCTHSAPIGITAGHAMSGSVVASACGNGDCTWTITTLDLNTGQRTMLAVADTENFWFAAGGAVEVYRLESCAQYPANGVFFSGISLYDKNMSLVSPSWSPSTQFGTDPSCHFNVTFTGNSVNLYHNPVTVTASGGLVACDPGFAGTCANGSSIYSVSASGNTITLRDHGGHTGSITLVGATASGSFTPCDPGFGGGCSTGSSIESMTVSGTNVITLADHGGHTGTITISGATVSGGFTACDPGFGGTCASGSSVSSVTAQSNTFIMRDSGHHEGYIVLSQ